MDIQAPWVGETPEEYGRKYTRKNKEFTLLINLSGYITIDAQDISEAREIARNMSVSELAEYVDEVEIDYE